MRHGYTAFLTPEEFRNDGHEALLGEFPVARAHVVVDPENFVQDNDRRSAP